MFNEPDESMGLAPLSHIKKTLDRLFGEGIWCDWEIETISFELKLILDPLTRDKISLLQAMGKDPDLFFNDIIFFLHAVEVMNNKVADFDSFPVPNSLEIAYAIEEAKVVGVNATALANPESDIVEALAYLLVEEGYSEPVTPFGFIPKSFLTPGQTPNDTEAKKEAIEVYIEHMGGL